MKTISSKRIVTGLEKLIGAFEQAQSKYRRFGAGDTEPDGVFHRCLVRAFKGGTFEVPTTAQGWELYSDMPGAGVAARALAARTKKCVEFIQSVPLACSDAVRRWLEEYCWRCDW